MMPYNSENEMSMFKTMSTERNRRKPLELNSQQEHLSRRSSGRNSSKPRRPRATIRERQRMAQVNSAFDHLRQVVPRGHVTEYQRLSKIATLRLAIEYIKAMNRILSRSPEDCSYSPNSALFSNSLLTNSLQREETSSQNWGFQAQSEPQNSWTNSYLNYYTETNSYLDGSLENQLNMGTY